MTDEPAVVATARDLRLAVGRLARRIRQLYAAANASSEATFTELAVLSRLAREGRSSPSALAGTERITAQAIGSSLRTLHERGLVERSPDPGDRRRVTVGISPAGRRALDDREHIITERLIAALGADFNRAELRRIAGVLPLLERLADRL